MDIENRRTFLSLCTGAAALSSSCARTGKNSAIGQPLQALREAYAAYNRGDTDATARFLGPDIEWIEPPEYPDGGVYRGLAAVTAYLRQSREGWVDGAFEPERFLTAGDKVVVLAHVRIRPKGSDAWRRATIVGYRRDGRSRETDSGPLRPRTPAV